MSAIEDKVCALIQQRAEAGLQKYGVTVERNDLSLDQWLTHALEESLDLAVYLMRIKEEIMKENMPVVRVSVLQEQCRTISVPSFKAYLAAHGWKQDVNSTMWRHISEHQSDHAPLLNMCSNTLAANGESHIQRSLNALAEFEGRHTYDLLFDIMQER